MHKTRFWKPCFELCIYLQECIRYSEIFERGNELFRIFLSALVLPLVNQWNAKEWITISRKFPENLWASLVWALAEIVEFPSSKAAVSSWLIWSYYCKHDRLLQLLLMMDNRSCNFVDTDTICFIHLSFSSSSCVFTVA